MNIEEIMKPYYEAKEAIKKEVQAKNLENEGRVEQLNLEKVRLQLRLERLTDRKQSEIDEYMLSIDAREYSYNPNYLITKRRELEAEYDKAEQTIKDQISEIDKELESINQVDHSNLLYDKRIPGIREVARAQAARLSMELEVKLESKTLELQLVDLDIKSLRNKFYSWQIEEANVDLQPYYQTKDRILKEIEELKKLIEQVKIESNLLYNDEELNEILKGNVEKIDFVNEPEKVVVEETEEKVEEPIELQQEELSKPIKLNDELDDDIDFGSPIPENEDEIEELEQVRPPLEPKEEELLTDTGVVEYDNVNEMLETIFADIVGCAKKLRTVKLDGELLSSKDFGKKDYEEVGTLYIDEEKIELPNGVYLNKSDISQALDNYKKEAKGRSFKVKGFDSTMTITSGLIRKVKKSLRDCSIIKLLSEKKLSHFDIKRVYGKDRAASYSDSVELGSVQSTMPSGAYVNLNEFVAKLGTTFAEKSESWVAKLKNRVKDFFEEKEEEEIASIEEEYEETSDLGNIDLDANLPFDDIKKVNIDEAIKISAEKDDFVPIQDIPQDKFVPIEYFDSSSIGSIDLDADMDFDDIKKINLGKTR